MIIDVRKWLKLKRFLIYFNSKYPTIFIENIEIHFVMNPRFCNLTVLRDFDVKIYTLKEHNTRKIDNSGRIFYVDGRRWKKKYKKRFS